MIIIGATRNNWTPGRHVVLARRQLSDELKEIPIVVLRETTWEAYRDYHEQEGISYDNPPLLGIRYYELLMD